MEDVFQSLSKASWGAHPDVERGYTTNVLGMVALALFCKGYFDVRITYRLSATSEVMDHSVRTILRLSIIPDTECNIRMT